jgi:LmbE family N-acetylglucosaminyl deacetylase
MREALRDVGTDLRLMCVAAHPDDEDGATLATYRIEYGYKTFAVITTRGEGGQNEIGSELYEELAVIRTREMQAATEVEGAELHFLNMPEFGYSKSLDETYAKWGKETLLKRMVRVIRLTRPDVIITNHGPTGGHGHHQVTGDTLQKAFYAAADPAVYPEQIEAGLETWQPARLYVRKRTGGTDIVNVDAYKLNEWRGLTYAEIAARALEQHESQGMGMFIDMYRNRRVQPSYSLVLEAPESDANSGGDVPAPGGSLFDGLSDRVSEAERKICGSTESRGSLFKPLMRLTGDVARDAGASDRLSRLHRAAGLAAQIRFDVQLEDENLTPGQTADLNVRLVDFKNPDVRSVTFELTPKPWLIGGTEQYSAVDVNSSRRAEARIDVVVPATAPLTVPHDEFVFADHFWEPQYTLTANIDTEFGPIALHRPIQFDVAPEVEIGFAGNPYLINEDGSVQYDVILTNHKSGASDGSLVIAPPDGLSLSETEIPFSLAAEGEQTVVPVRAEMAGAPGGEARDFNLTASIKGTEESRSASALSIPLKVPENINVGVIESYDDTFILTLERLNVPHAELTIEDFVPDRLDEFTTIILDIRAYLVRPDLVANNQALLDYVERGGNVIVGYQKTFEWKPDLAPYPINVGRGRVTVEDAPITILVPDHPLFNVPNKIEASDWDGWKQERGLYFPSRWDDAYTPLLACNDPGDSPLEGSCLYAEYGEGTYFYTALVWYRQIRRLHPGATKVFANMLALGQDAH